MLRYFTKCRHLYGIMSLTIVCDCGSLLGLWYKPTCKNYHCACRGPSITLPSHQQAQYYIEYWTRFCLFVCFIWWISNFSGYLNFKLPLLTRIHYSKLLTKSRGTVCPASVFDPHFSLLSIENGHLTCRLRSKLSNDSDTLTRYQLRLF